MGESSGQVLDGIVSPLTAWFGVTLSSFSGRFCAPVNCAQNLRLTRAMRESRRRGDCSIRENSGTEW